MSMFNGLTIQDLFLVVVGAAILVVGTTSFRLQRRIRKQGLVREGTVTGGKHVEKKDGSGQLIQNYYDLMVEYSVDGHRRRKALKSVDEYLPGDRIRVIRDPGKKDEVTVYEDHKVTVFGPGALILSGLLIAVLPVVRVQYGELYMSVNLALVLAVIGTSLIMAYLRDRKRNLIPIEAEIVDLLYWKTGDDKKKWSKPSVSYYPVLRYSVDGVERIMRSRYNSSTETAYKAGMKRKLYQDMAENRILERGPRKSMLAVGIAILLFAAVGICSAFV